MEYNPFGNNVVEDDPFEDDSHYVEAPLETNPFAQVQPSPKKKKKKTKTKPAAIATFPGEDEDAPRGGDVAYVERLKALEARENALREKEEELAEMERKLRSGQLNIYNWPFPCYAILYHSIKDEIPQQHRSTMRLFYLLVFLTWAFLIANWLAVMVYSWGTDRTWNPTTDSLWSTIYLVVGSYGAWSFWYRKLYFVLRDKKSLGWIGFFLWFGGHIIFTAFMLLGIETSGTGTGSGGILVMILLFSKKENSAGFFCLVAVGLMTVVMLLSIYLLKQAYAIYKNTGGKRNVQKEMGQAMLQAQMESDADANSTLI